MVRVHLHCAALRGARRHVAVAEAKLKPLPSFGLILSFARLIIALGQPSLTTSPMALSVLILVAGALRGSTALVIKPIPLRSISPEKVLSYQLAVAAVVGTVRVLALGERLGPIAASAVGECSVRSSDCRRHVFFGSSFLRFIRQALQAGTSLTPLFGVPVPISSWGAGYPELSVGSRAGCLRRSFRQPTLTDIWNQRLEDHRRRRRRPVWSSRAVSRMISRSSVISVIFAGSPFSIASIIRCTNSRASARSARV